MEQTSDQADVGWVNVDQNPARDSITSLATKWTHVYASYLENRVSREPGLHHTFS